VSKAAIRIFLIAGLALLASGGPAAQVDPAEAPRAMGLIPLDARQVEEIVAGWERVNRVGLNPLGFERVNEVRAQRGKPALDLAIVRPAGEEVDGILAARGPSVLAAAANLDMAADLPVTVDNSLLRFFPPVRNQGSLGSCASFASTYYQFSYMTAFQKNLDIRDTADNTNKYSPKWTYNMVNGGKNEGSTFYDNYSILEKHGAATWADFPYDSNFTAWCLNPTAWRSALGVRTRVTQYVYDASTDLGLEQIKELLTDGYIVVFGTYVRDGNFSAWVSQPISDDPSTSDDNAAVGKAVCVYVNSTDGGHAMNIVGYNDAIWTDINGNSLIDPGEKGAFRIANSWGTGWRDGGFTWLAYDALRETSAVLGGPSTGRVQAFQSDMVFVLRARNNYTPSVVGEFTVSHAKRDQMRAILGRSNTTATVPSTTWNPSMLRNQGGAFAFDGSTTAVSGTFVLDFTDILAAGAGLQRYYVGINDNAANDAATLSAFKIVDLTTEPDTETVSSLVPQNADNQQIYAYVDYNYQGAAYNDPPQLSSAGVDPANGLAGDTYTFTARYADPDGDVPTVKNVVVDGTPHATTLFSGTGANGWYSFAMTLAAGPHAFYFYFEDGKGESAREPLAGETSGPAVYGLLATSLSPSSAPAGGDAFTLTVNGTDFASGAVVTWDGSDRTTSYVSSARLSAQIAAADLTLGRSVPVAVRNPGGLTSNSLLFAVNNPVPSLASIDPTAASGGGSGAALTLYGSGFVPNSVAHWNGTARSTTYVSATELQAALTAQDLLTGGEFVVTVFNPVPAGGNSRGVSFLVSDYSATASSYSFSVSAGQSANTTVQVTPEHGSFDATVSFSCTNLPRGCTASFSPQTVSPGAAVATTTLTLKTTARGGSAAALTAGPAGLVPPALGLVLLFLAFGSGMLIRMEAALIRTRRRLATVALIFLMVWVAGCSAGGGGGSQGQGTPAGTYYLSVHATSGTLDALVPITLVVK
jgi:C1A family cysteine protease